VATRDSYVQRREEHNRGIEVEQGRHARGEPPHPKVEVPARIDARRDGAEEPELVEQQGERHGREKEGGRSRELRRTSPVIDAQ
jgi:hypothetical protein